MVVSLAVIVGRVPEAMLVSKVVMATAVGNTLVKVVW